MVGSPRSLTQDLQNNPSTHLIASIFEATEHSPLLDGLAEFLSKAELQKPNVLASAKKFLQVVREHLKEVDTRVEEMTGGVARYREEVCGVVSSFDEDS